MFDRFVLAFTDFGFDMKIGFAVVARARDR